MEKEMHMSNSPLRRLLGFTAEQVGTEKAQCLNARLGDAVLPPARYGAALNVEQARRLAGPT